MIPTQNPKVVDFKIADITIDASRNLREDTVESYDLAPLIGDIATRGLMTEISLEEIDDPTNPGKKIYVPVRGFRRSRALQYLATNLNPETQKPFIDPNTITDKNPGGRPFETVKVKIYKNLTEAERILLMFDHGQTKTLNMLELFHAIGKCYDAMMREVDIVRLSFALLKQFYPPTRPIADTDQARLEYYKGALQPMKWAWMSPTVLRTAYETKLRGQQNWPTKKELKELYDLYEKERAADKRNVINRENPGPEFKARWAKYVADKATVSENGKPKQSSMLNRGQVDDLKKLVDSRIGKTWIDVILQEIPREKVPTLDRFMLELEGTLTDRQREIFDAIAGAVEPAEEAEAVTA